MLGDVLVGQRGGYRPTARQPLGAILLCGKFGGSVFFFSNFDNLGGLKTAEFGFELKAKGLNDEIKTENRREVEGKRSKFGSEVESWLAGSSLLNIGKRERGPDIWKTFHSNFRTLLEFFEEKHLPICVQLT